MVCFKFSHAFLFMQTLFVPGNYTNILPTKDEKFDTPAWKIASKSFPIKKSAFADETGWLKKLRERTSEGIFCSTINFTCSKILKFITILISTSKVVCYCDCFCFNKYDLQFEIFTISWLKVSFSSFEFYKI